MGAVRELGLPTTMDSVTADVIEHDTLPFPFWGFTECWVSVDGFIIFKEPGPDDWWDQQAVYGGNGYNGKPPNPGIYPLWWYFIIDSESSVTYGPCTVEGNNCYAVTWDNVLYYEASYYGSPPGARTTFQVVMFENESFEMNYDSVPYGGAPDQLTEYPTWAGIPDGSQVEIGWRKATADNIVIEALEFDKHTNTYSNSPATTVMQLPYTSTIEWPYYGNAAWNGIYDPYSEPYYYALSDVLLTDYSNNHINLHFPNGQWVGNHQHYTTFSARNRYLVGALVEMEPSWTGDDTWPYSFSNYQPNGPIEVMYQNADKDYEPIASTHTTLDWAAFFTGWSYPPASSNQYVYFTPLDINGDPLASPIAVDTWAYSYSYTALSHYGFKVEHPNPGNWNPSGWGINYISINFTYEWYPRYYSNQYPGNSRLGDDGEKALILNSYNSDVLGRYFFGAIEAGWFPLRMTQRDDWTGIARSSIIQSKFGNGSKQAGHRIGQNNTYQ